MTEWRRGSFQRKAKPRVTQVRGSKDREEQREGRRHPERERERSRRTDGQGQARAGGPGRLVPVGEGWVRARLQLGVSTAGDCWCSPVQGRLRGRERR